MKLAALLAACLAVAVAAQDPATTKVVPGEFFVDPPTLENLGFRWFIGGDSNRNASVAVSYRKKGDSAWRPSLPMLRVHHEVVNQQFGPHRVGNLFAGSVLFLQPATEYEVKFEMRDPDGGAPPAKVVAVATRGEPKAWDGGRKLDVYPERHTGQRVPASFVGLMAAYAEAKPGDILLLHRGVYKAAAPYVLAKSGEAAKPIVFRGGVDGEAVLEASGHGSDILHIAEADHLMFEDLTLRHARVAIDAGQKGARGSSGLVVRRCRIEDVIYGIRTYSENSENWYIADNVLTGINPTWYPRPDERYMEPSHTGVNTYGRGHVVCHNRISRFSDGMALANFGVPLADPRKHAVSVDFYNNDLSFAQDDALETDYGCHNVRVYRNRCYNAHSGLSVQPFYGGPVYLIRNEIYGVTAITFKLHNFCAGIEAYHNTAASAGMGFMSFDRWQNGHFRNNIFLGGAGHAMATGTITPYSSLDYNGYRSNGPEDLIRWYDGKARQNFKTLADFFRVTGHEQHGVMVDYDIFVRAKPPERGVTSDPALYDLRLRPAAVAVDRGVALPGVNDDFRGKAPDLGCHEQDTPAPHYGPRERRPPSVVLNLDKSPHAVLRTVPVGAVKIGEGFWAPRRKVNVEKSIPTLLQLLEEHGAVDNFRRLSGRKDVERRGPLYTDSDVYKWMESVAFVLQSEDRPELRKTFDELTEEILAAQEPSGYLNTFFQDDRKHRRWKEMHSGHELYCLGHMLQAAIAYYRATGNRRLLDGGIRFVEYLIRDFGPGKQPLLAGHPEIELALIELYRTTGERKYLDLAAYILRGDGKRLGLTPSQISYMFSGIPFTDRKIMEGHAVRAGYACSGAADYYLETGDPAYRAALDRLWDDMTRSKMYITGGIGSRGAGEAFGDPYELPNARAYTESCAAIANLMWNWRLLHATADAKYADIVETALYNSINSGMSLSGTLYCYRNPLELSKSASERIRNPWYGTTCCPPNLERMFASLPGYFYSTSKEGLYVHLYDNNELDWRLEDGTPLIIKVTTKYPWEGVVDITVSPKEGREFTLFLRIPAWTTSAKVAVNGKPAAAAPQPGTYLALRREWKTGDKVRLDLDMSQQILVSNPQVKENTGRAAVRRGPLVYLLEQTGQPSEASVLEAALDLRNPFTAEYRAELLGGVTVLKHRGWTAPKPFAELPLYRRFDPKAPATGARADLILTPYYTFANRGPSAMQVWVNYVR